MDSIRGGTMVLDRDALNGAFTSESRPPRGLAARGLGARGLGMRARRIGRLRRGGPNRGGNAPGLGAVLCRSGRQISLIDAAGSRRLGSLPDFRCALGSLVQGMELARLRAFFGSWASADLCAFYSER